MWRVCVGVKKEWRETCFSEKGHTRERVSKKSQRQRGRTAVWQSKKRNRENWVRRGRYKPNRKTRVNWASEVETKHITVFQDNPATTLNPNKNPRQFYLENCSLLPPVPLLIKSEARGGACSAERNLNNLNSSFFFFFKSTTFHRKPFQGSYPTCSSWSSVNIPPSPQFAIYVFTYTCYTNEIHNGFIPLVSEWNGDREPLEGVS